MLTDLKRAPELIHPEVSLRLRVGAREKEREREKKVERAHAKIE